jgi:hypothetical protein
MSGPGAVTFGTPASAVTTAQFAAAGTYVLRLTASDSEATAFDEVVVTVGEQNHAPTVNAGADQTVNLSQEANLNGTVSDDGLPQGSSVSTTWSKVSGPVTVTFADQGVTVTTATFSEEGTYVLRLTATDSELTAADDLVVKVDPAQDKPTVEIVSPSDGAEVTSPVDVVDSDIEERPTSFRKQYSYLEWLKEEWGSNRQNYTCHAPGRTGDLAKELQSVDSPMNESI